MVRGGSVISTWKGGGRQDDGYGGEGGRVHSFQKLCKGLLSLRMSVGVLLNFLTYFMVRCYVLKLRIKNKGRSDYVLLGMACNDPTFT